MKHETKFLMMVALTFLIIVVVSINIVEPSALSVIGLIVSVIITAFALRSIMGETIQTGRTHYSSHSPPRVYRPEMDRDPDRVVERMVSAVEDVIEGTDDKGTPFEGLLLRQELQRRLGDVLGASTGYQLSGQNREVSILFSDLRGFTATTEGRSAKEVVEMLNRYFTHMCEIIYRHGGIVDKFMGDSIMALFGAPVGRPNDVEHAVCCAAEMQIRMDTFNKENEKLGMPYFYMGIGLNTGEVVAGKIGSDLHSEYTVIGDEVNLTSRIEAYTLRGQILMSLKTYSRVKDIITAADPLYVSVKGRHDPVALYELLSVEGPYQLKVPEREARRSLRADVNIPFQFQILEGKVVRPDAYGGCILNISADGMLASTQTDVEPFWNLIFRLDFSLFNMKTDDIYGKILRVKKTAEYNEVHIEFTAINPKDKDAVNDLVSGLVRGGLCAT